MADVSTDGGADDGAEGPPPSEDGADDGADEATSAHDGEAATGPVLGVVSCSD